jgi:hypothetical protein
MAKRSKTAKDASRRRAASPTPRARASAVEKAGGPLASTRRAEPKHVQANRTQGHESPSDSEDPTPQVRAKINLATIRDVRLEMSSLYRSMKAGEMETGRGTKLAFVLSQVGKLLEVDELERRVDEMEARLAAAAQTN